MGLEGGRAPNGPVPRHRSDCRGAGAVSVRSIAVVGGGHSAGVRGLPAVRTVGSGSGGGGGRHHSGAMSVGKGTRY